MKFAKKKIVNQPNKIIIPYFWYFDDYETNNPLGTHAGIKKLGAVYISFTPCLSPEFSSSLNNIFLALLFNSLDRKQFLNKMTFKQ